MNEEKNNKKYVIYSRKSKLTGKGESIENQIDICRQYLFNKYGDISNKIIIFQDEGFTGYNTNRPQFQEMINIIRKKEVICVIVYRLDRISRNVSDFCNLKNEFEKYNVAFISVTENFDTSTPMGAAMLMISSVFAQLERDTIAERIKDNMYELAKTGRWLGGTTPLGYISQKIEKIQSNNKKYYSYQLKSIIKEEEIVKLIWNKMLELKGLSKLEAYLVQNGVKTRNGNNFTRFSLINILKNPVYVIADNKIKTFFEQLGATIYVDEKEFDEKRGLIAYNKRLEKCGKNKRNKNIDEWIIALGNHNGLITSDDFIKTWELLSNNQNKRLRTPQKNNSILSGLIRCFYCGSYMRPKLYQTYNNGQRNFSYLCELKEKSRKKLCHCQNINGIKLDNIVLQIIKEQKTSIKNLLIELEKKEIKNSNDENELLSLKKVLIDNKRKITNLIERISLVDQEIVKDISYQIKKLKEQNINIEKRINSFVNNIDDKSNIDIDILINDIFNFYWKQFDLLNIVEKRNLLKLILEKVVVNNNDVYIYFNIP